MKKRSREASFPDITPLIDVVFLLLIFFMVSTVFKKDEMALLLNLPKAANGAGKEVSKKTWIVELNEGGLAINGKKKPFEAAEGEFMALSDKKTPIDLRVDKAVRYEKLVQLLDLLKKLELTNISLITEK